MDSKFIARYRRAIHEVEAGNASLELANKLERLGYKLTSSLERDFEENPGSEKPYTLLKKALRECLQIEESARIKTRAYLNASTPDIHDAEYDIVRAVYGTLEDVISNLLLLLLTHWQEIELPEKCNFLIEWNRSKPMMELVKEFGRFTVPHELMRSRLNAAKLAATKAAVGTLDNASKPFTMEELALFCVYSQILVTKENAKDYLEAKLTSGIALYNKFTYYSKLSNRIGFDDATALVRKNMIARIQKVLPRLTGEQKNRSENEIVILSGQNQ